MSRGRARSPLKKNAEQKFPVRVRVVVPEDGFGPAYDDIYAWLRERFGVHDAAICSDIQPGRRDAVAIYLPDLATARAMIDRFELELCLDSDKRLF